MPPLFGTIRKPDYCESETCDIINSAAAAAACRHTVAADEVGEPRTLISVKPPAANVLSDDTVSSIMQ